MYTMFKHSSINPLWYDEPIMIVDQTNFCYTGVIRFFHFPPDKLQWMVSEEKCKGLTVAIFKVKPKHTFIADKIIEQAFNAS